MMPGSHRRTRLANIIHGLSANPSTISTRAFPEDESFHVSGLRVTSALKRMQGYTIIV